MDKEYGKLRVKPSNDINKKNRIPRVPRVKSNDMVVRVLKEEKTSNLDEFLRIYKSDPYVARVYFKNGGNTGANNPNTLNIYNIRYVLLVFSNGDFELNKYHTNFGISKTNKIYTRQKKVESIIYKKDRFWYVNNELKVKSIRPLSYFNYTNFIHQLGSDKKLVIDFFKTKFFWFKAYNEYDLRFSIIFNTIVSRKLYGHDDMDRYLLKVNKNVVKAVKNTIVKNNVNDCFSEFDSNYISKLKDWLKYLPLIDNVDSITEEFLRYPNLSDTFSLADKLGKRINAKWGRKKFIEMHDTWGFELSRILLKTVECVDLKILDLYRDFAEFSGYDLLTTNHAVFKEGIEKRHCVGGYINNIENGSCAIFSINGRYTLQVSGYELVEIIDGGYLRLKPTSKNKHVESLNISGIDERLIKELHKGFIFLKNNQFKGYKNDVDLPSKELVDEINDKILEYNLSGRANSFIEDLSEEVDTQVNAYYDNLPF